MSDTKEKPKGKLQGRAFKKLLEDELYGRLRELHDRDYKLLGEFEKRAQQYAEEVRAHSKVSVTKYPLRTYEVTSFSLNVYGEVRASTPNLSPGLRDEFQEVIRARQMMKNDIDGIDRELKRLENIGPTDIISLASQHPEGVRLLNQLRLVAQHVIREGLRDWDPKKG